MALLERPGLPFSSDLKFVEDGFIINFTGSTSPAAKRFFVDFTTSPSPGADIPLHISVRLSPEATVVRNAQLTGRWGQEDLSPCPITPGTPFELMVLVEDDSFKIAINGEHYAEFPHRTDYRQIKAVRVDGDGLSLDNVQFESAGLPQQMQEMNLSGPDGGAPPSYGYGEASFGAPPPAYGAPAAGPTAIGFNIGGLESGGQAGGGPYPDVMGAPGGAPYGLPSDQYAGAGGYGVGAEAGAFGQEEEGWFSRKKKPDKYDYSVDPGAGDEWKKPKKEKKPGFMSKAAPGFVGGLVGGAIAGYATAKLAYPGRKHGKHGGGDYGGHKSKHSGLKAAMYSGAGGMLGGYMGSRGGKKKKHKKHKKEKYGYYEKHGGSGSSSSSSSGSSGSSSCSGSCSD